MRSIFISIKGDAAGYAANKFQAELAYTDNPVSPEHIETVIKSALAQIKRPAPRIASPDQFYDADKRQMLRIEVAERNAAQCLVEDAPLLEGEEIEEDFFSYLLDPVDNIPANTGVLRRRTNMAEILYIFDFVKIENGDIAYIPEPQPEVGHPRPLLKLSFTITTEMIKKLLKNAGAKAVGAGLSKVGTIVLNLVMKEMGMENDTEKLLGEVRKIIKEEIDAAEITKIEGVVDGTLQFMMVEYKNQKAKLDLSKIENRRTLMNDLKSYSNKFYTDVIGTLKQERYAVRGLKTFMFAAPVHLLLTQEMALVDPDYMNPNESGFLQTLRDNATIYRNHVQNAYNKAINDRNNMEVYSQVFVDTMGNSTVRKTTWWWRDNVSGEKAGQFMDSKNPDVSAQQHARESLEKHRNDVLNKRREELGKPQETFLDSIGDLQNYTFPKS